MTLKKISQGWGQTGITAQNSESGSARPAIAQCPNLNRSLPVSTMLLLFSFALSPSSTRRRLA